jgi:hypothetical protein
VADQQPRTPAAEQEAIFLATTLAVAQHPRPCRCAASAHAGGRSASLDLFLSHVLIFREVKHILFLLFKYY